MGRTCVDVDHELEKKLKHFHLHYRTRGTCFREKEAEMIAKFGTQTGLIISTGGGCVTVPKNFAHLRQNGRMLPINTTSRKPLYLWSCYSLVVVSNAYAN